MEKIILKKGIFKIENGIENIVTEIELSEDMICGEHVIVAEQNFLKKGSVAFGGVKESSEQYIAELASQVLGVEYQELIKLPINEFNQIVREIRGFIGYSDSATITQEMMEKLDELLEK